MSSRTLVVSATVIVLSIFVTGGWAQQKYVPRADEELYGTWTNGQNSGDWFRPQKLVLTANQYAEYCNTEALPTFTWRLRIDDKWTDTDGNIWYKVFAIGTGCFKGHSTQELYKLSKSGTVMERALEMTTTGKDDPTLYPKGIDPNAPVSYWILRREGK